MHEALSFLRATPISPHIEVVLCAPATALAHVAARLVPPRIRLASAMAPNDRREIRIAGARATTGNLVIVVDCNEDLKGRLTDPFANGEPPPSAENPAAWAADLDAGQPIQVISRVDRLEPLNS